MSQARLKNRNVVIVVIVMSIVTLSHRASRLKLWGNGMLIFIEASIQAAAQICV